MSYAKPQLSAKPCQIFSVLRQRFGDTSQMFSGMCQVFGEAHQTFGVLRQTFSDPFQTFGGVCQMFGWGLVRTYPPCACCSARSQLTASASVMHWFMRNGSSRS